MRIRLFSHYVHVSTAAMAAIEALVFLGAMLLAYRVRFESWFPVDRLGSTQSLWLCSAVFVGANLVSILAFGLYSSRQRARMSGVFVRLVAAVAAAAAGTAAVFYVFPSLWVGRGVLGLASLFALAGAGASRAAFTRMMDESLLKRRVLVYGVGQRTTAISGLRRRSDRRGFEIVGYVQPDGESIAVPPGAGAERIGQHSQVVYGPRCPGDCRGHGGSAAWIPHTGAAGVSARRHRSHGAADFPRARDGSCAHRCAEPELDEFRGGLPARSGTPVLLQGARSRGEPGAPRAVVAVHADHNGRDQARGWLAGAGFLRPGARGSRREPAIHGTQVQKHAYRCRAGRPGTMGAEVRPSRYACGRGDPQAADRRATADSQRGDRTDELRGPASGAAAVRGRARQKIPYYVQRHCVKPGITGWAQLCYPYGSSEEDALEKLQYDLYYIKNNTLLFDLAILVQTAEVVFMGKGAR